MASHDDEDFDGEIDEDENDPQYLKFIQKVCFPTIFLLCFLTHVLV